jgi:hypothetical protein
VCGEAAAGVSEPDAARASLEQRNAGFAFKGSEGLAHSWWCVAERLRGAGDGTVPFELDESGQTVRLEHKPSLCFE